jgi:hypothetical protein
MERKEEITITEFVRPGEHIFIYPDTISFLRDKRWGTAVGQPFVPKTLGKLLKNYTKIHTELLAKKAEAVKALQFLSALNDRIRETEAEIRLVKDKKNKALDLNDSTRLIEINGELESLGYQLGKLEAQIPPFTKQHQDLRESANKLREAIIYPERFLLHAIAEDIKSKMIEKCKGELNILAAINQEVIGSVKLNKVFADVEIRIGIGDAEEIINSTIASYGKEFHEAHGAVENGQ